MQREPRGLDRPARHQPLELERALGLGGRHLDAEDARERPCLLQLVEVLGRVDAEQVLERGRARLEEQLAVEKAGWGRPLPSRRGRGVSVHRADCANAVSLSMGQADRLIDAILKRGAEQELRPLAVIVVEPGCKVKAFKKEDGASMIRFEMTFGKCYAALALGLSLDWLAFELLGVGLLAALLFASGLPFRRLLLVFVASALWLLPKMFRFARRMFRAVLGTAESPPAR